MGWVKNVFDDEAHRVVMNCFYSAWRLLTNTVLQGSAFVPVHVLVGSLLSSSPWWQLQPWAYWEFPSSFVPCLDEALSSLAWAQPAHGSLWFYLAMMGIINEFWSVVKQCWKLIIKSANLLGSFGSGFRFEICSLDLSVEERSTLICILSLLLLLLSATILLITDKTQRKTVQCWP